MFSIRSYKQVFDLKQDYFSSLRLKAAINLTLSGNTNEVVIPLNITIKIRKKKSLKNKKPWPQACFVYWSSEQKLFLHDWFLQWITPKWDIHHFSKCACLERPVSLLLLAVLVWSPKQGLGRQLGAGRGRRALSFSLSMYFCFCKIGQLQVCRCSLETLQP